ncbi:MAG: SMI1/KNR4 family protein [Pseudomonas sp.]|uniref:SMI1/KNR4 family protein n=1 Tax=Pseudomonas sp. TaxID=306 RepID=UPI00339A04F3
MSFIDKLIAAGLNQERPIAGISEKEILDLERKENVTLPGSYRQFLEECGRSAGLFQRDADFFYPAIRKLKEELKEMLKEERLEFDLPRNAFVFGAYQGCQYCLFFCDGNDDPPVYLITDAGGAAVKISENFSGYVEKAICEYRGAFMRVNAIGLEG